MMVAPEASSALTVTILPVEAVPDVMLFGMLTVSEAMTPLSVREIGVTVAAVTVTGTVPVERMLPASFWAL